MTAPGDSMLTGRPLELFQLVLHRGSDDASSALGRWIDKPTTITFDAIEQHPLDEATTVLGESDAPVCFCLMRMTGRLTGQLILAFDDASGLALSDMLLDQPRGTATTWGDMETSAALETANILGCAYLNSLARVLPAVPGQPEALIPSPPRFCRDFAESLMEFALIDQIAATDHVLLARTEFQIDGAPVDWTLLFVPDATSMAMLQNELGRESVETGGAGAP